METKIIRKWFWAWDFEKEEEWLNGMAREGWVLDKVGFCKYTFVKCQPEEYTVRLEMHKKDEEYLSFMKETGAEYIGRMVQWIYWRKKPEDGAFDLFSDLDSRIVHLKSISNVLRIIALLNVGIGVANSFNPIIRTGWVNLLCAVLLMYGAGRLDGMTEALKKERRIREI